jgi:hypothetical protein
MKTLKRSEITIQAPRFQSAGHYKLEIIDNDFNSYSCTTTNMSIPDDWNESDDYYEDDNSGHWYNSHEEVEQAIIYEISRKNNLEVI